MRRRKRLISRTRNSIAISEWYKHHIYAPGFYTGYGVKTIPGVREAIEQRDYDKVGPQIEIAAGVLNRIAEHIEMIAAELAGDSS
jgi:N-acetylated-alpha-linked acidic dipeptidase